MLAISQHAVRLVDEVYATELAELSEDMTSRFAHGRAVEDLSDIARAGALRFELGTVSRVAQADAFPPELGERGSCSVPGGRLGSDTDVKWGIADLAEREVAGEIPTAAIA